ncbi:uncharacterized protein LOC143459997 [Clavelina lepadiformis]|uniref:uncharacterized protein LOC143459997 n=1 Tax=Clavelina lepadiformis TaxID=159417 RepID=UPI0040422C65
MKKHSVIRGIKCTIAVLVVILWVVSIAILGVVTVIRDNLSHVVIVTENTTSGDFYLDVFFPVILPVLITVSCFVFVIGCLGCCGAFTESQILLGWFFFSLLVTFCVELSAGIWRMVDYDLSYNETDIEQLKINIDKYEGENPSALWFTSAWKEVQREFQCCGVDSFEDWLQSHPDLLRSCCPYNIERIQCAHDFGIMEGCGEKLLQYLSSSPYMKSIPYLTAIMGIIQVVAMILTLKLWLTFCFAVKTQYDGYDIDVKHGSHPQRQYHVTHRKGVKLDNTSEVYYFPTLAVYDGHKYRDISRYIPTRSDGARSSSNRSVGCTNNRYLCNIRNEPAAYPRHVKTQYLTTPLSNWVGATQSPKCDLLNESTKHAQDHCIEKSNSAQAELIQKSGIGEYSRLTRSCSSFLIKNGWDCDGESLQNASAEAKTRFAIDRDYGVGATVSERSAHSPMKTKDNLHTIHKSRTSINTMSNANVGHEREPILDKNVNQRPQDVTQLVSFKKLGSTLGSVKKAENDIQVENLPRPKLSDSPTLCFENNAENPRPTNT